VRALEAEVARLEAAVRLRNEILASTAHDVRTHMNAILGFGQLLQDPRTAPPLEPEQREFLTDLLDSAEGLRRLIGDVLDLARVEAGRVEVFLEPADLGAAAKEAVGLLRSAATKRRVTVSVAPDVSPAVAPLDRAKAVQVLYTFLSHAIAATPEGGRVTVAVRPRGEDRFAFEVTDGGPAVPADDVNRRFAEFHEAAPGGSGLSLALARRLIEVQGGTVGVSSSPAGGTTWVAVLPRETRE
jgi:protein-histidine pros-kinase